MVLWVAALGHMTGCGLLTGPDDESTPRYDTLVAGGVQNCARSLDGRWYCWGKVQSGRGALLGPDARAPDVQGEWDWTRPAPLLEDPGLGQASAAATFTCGTSEVGIPYCWAAGGRMPEEMGTHIRFSRLAEASVPHHMCGLDLDGRAYCWGNNHLGQLGAAVDDPHRPDIVPVVGGHAFVVIAVEGVSTCALTAATDYYCWGRPAFIGHTLDEPTLIASNTGLEALTGWGGVWCGLRSGRAFCQGLDPNGVRGRGDTEPGGGFVEVTGGHRFRQLSAGRIHICGVTVNDEAYCWGSGDKGRLGNGLEVPAPAPVAVGGGHRFEVVRAGGNHTCGLTTGGEVYCWGSGVFGQIGNGETQDQLLPAKIAPPPVEP